MGYSWYAKVCCKCGEPFLTEYLSQAPYHIKEDGAMNVEKDKDHTPRESPGFDLSPRAKQIATAFGVFVCGMISYLFLRGC